MLLSDYFPTRRYVVKQCHKINILTVKDALDRIDEVKKLRGVGLQFITQLQALSWEASRPEATEAVPYPNPIEHAKSSIKKVDEFAVSTQLIHTLVLSELSNGQLESVFKIVLSIREHK